MTTKAPPQKVEDLLAALLKKVEQEVEVLQQSDTPLLIEEDQVELLRSLHSHLQSILQTTSAIQALAALAFRMQGMANGDGRKQGVKEAKQFLPDVECILKLMRIELVSDPDEALDPACHRVIQRVPITNEGTAGRIARISRPGIRLNGSVLTPAYVDVYESEKSTEDNHADN